MMLRLKIKYFVAWSLLISVLSAGFGFAETQVKSCKYALLIGIDNYEGHKDFKSLQGAKNDVELIKSVLIEHFKFDPENVMVLVDDKATHANIQAEFQKLSEKAKAGDFIYIHYSGHGSYTCDLNGDESEHSGKDSTWVSYGSRILTTSEPLPKTCAEIQNLPESQIALIASRSAQPSELNTYDILDDEIHAWLNNLTQKTDQVVFVSDSCHSGTITRGDVALMARGTPMDFRPHPMGMMPLPDKPFSGIRLSACRDDETACEYRENNMSYGLLTWFWAQSLKEAVPGISWGDLYKQVCAKIRHQYSSIQSPQIEGAQNNPVFGSQFDDRSKRIAVWHISSDKKTARIDSGSLLGVTKGSIYSKFDPASKSEPAKIEITRVMPTWSEGNIKGAVLIGDLVILELYQPETSPLKIMIRADMNEYQHIADKIKTAVSKLPAYECATDQRQSDFVLQLLSPKTQADHTYIYKNPDDSLPQSFADQPVECWILTPDERLYNEDLIISLKDVDKGIDAIIKNLEKISRVRNLTTLTAGPGQESPVKFNVTLWRRLYTEQSAKPVADSPFPSHIQVDNSTWRQEKAIAVKETEPIKLNTDTLLTFVIDNTSNKAYYTYLINIMSDGRVKTFYPPEGYSIEYGLIEAGKKHKIEEVILIMDKPGKEYMRLIASLDPIDIRLLDQKGYEQRGEKLTPLESLIANRAGMERGGSGGSSISVSEWSTMQVEFIIKGY